MILLGIDLGTTKAAAVSIDTKEGGVVHTASREHRAGIAGSAPWEQAQDPEIILSAARELLREASEAAAERSRRVEGICITGQMHGMLYLDESGNALSPLYTWLDARGGLSHTGGGSYAEVLSERTGFRLAPGFGSVTHFYNREHDLVPARAVALCTVLDYVTMRLCGVSRPVSDATTAASLGLFDLDALRFDRKALEAAGFDDVEPPEVVAAGTPVGRAEGDATLFAPVADNQASFIGSVREPEHSLLVNVGTAGQISGYSPLSTPPSPEIEVRPYPGGGYLHVGAALCSGKAYEHLRSFFRAVLRVFEADDRRVDYDAINRLVESADPQAADRLVVDTRFAGTRLDPSITGGVANIGLDNFTPERLARGYVEGIAEELFAFSAAMEGPAGRRAHVVGSGNGVRTNVALREALERRLERPLELPLLREEAALGAALCAGVAAGEYPDFRSAGEIISYEA